MNLDHSAFSLEKLEHLPPEDIQEFVIALARRDAWAVNAVGGVAGDSPFDRLSSHWMASSEVTKYAIASGIISYLDVVSAIDCGINHKANAQGIVEVLGFCIMMLPDLDPDYARRFLPPLTFWLNSEIGPPQQIAATGIASMKTLDALRELEATADLCCFPEWILPSLLEKRSKTEPYSLFAHAEKWMGRALNDAVSSAALQDGIERMVEAGAARAFRTIQDLRFYLQPDEMQQIASLVGELTIPGWTVLPQDGGFNIKAAVSHSTASDFLSSLEFIEQCCRKKLPNKHISGFWEDLLRGIPDRSQSMEHKWDYIRDFSKEVSERANDDTFFVTLRSALYGTSRFRRVTKWTQDIQRAFYDRKLRDSEADLSLIRGCLRDRVHLSSVEADNVPPKLRIPTVIYAEEAYMETLRLLLKAHFGDSLPIVEVPNISWDRLDTELAKDECDLGLNNDDILSHRGSPREPLLRLAGPALYKADNFLILARVDFLESSRGVVDIPLEPTFTGGCVLDGIPEEKRKATLVSLLLEGKISVPRATVLETKLRELVESASGPVKNIVRETSDRGLVDFLSGDRAMYFGGSLQTSYAVRTWPDGVVPLCRLSMPINGRLFARPEFAKQYPEFMMDLAELTTDLDHAFESVADPDYHEALQSRLVHHLNGALLASSTNNVTILQSYDQLERALDQSELAPAGRGSRDWEVWTSAQDRSKDTPVTVLGGGVK